MATLTAIYGPLRLWKLWTPLTLRPSAGSPDDAVALLLLLLPTGLARERHVGGGDGDLEGVGVKYGVVQHVR